MPLYQVIILAIVQGFTEFLPVSSTAHLFLTSWLLGWKPETLEFDIALHVGTLAAVLVYFFKDWVQIAAQGLGMDYGRDLQLRQNRALLWLIAIGTLPVGVAGLAFGEQAETTWRNPFVMAVMLIGVGVVMWVADRRLMKKRDLASVDAGRRRRYRARAGARHRPRNVPQRHHHHGGAVPRHGPRSGGALLLPALHARHRRGRRESAAMTWSSRAASSPTCGCLSSSAWWSARLTGWLVIAWFLRYLRHSSLAFFVYYRIIFGIIVLALAFFRWPAG